VIVVDTTVWIDFLEARGTAFDRHLTELVEHDASIALVDIVYCEILQGIRNEDTIGERGRACWLTRSCVRAVSRRSRRPRICIGRRGAAGSRSDEAWIA